MDTVKLVECPRDAWQGLPDFIPTEYKVAYLQALVAAGFKHIDAVSFVSPKHVKQMADSEEVMRQLASSTPDIVCRPRRAGNYRHRRKRKRPRARTRHARSYNHRLPILHLRIFPPRQRQHDPRRNPPARRKTKKGNHHRKARPGHLHFHGLRQSLRRTMGLGNRRRNLGMAERHPHQHRVARRHRWNRFCRSSSPISIAA